MLRAMFSGKLEVLTGLLSWKNEEISIFIPKISFFSSDAEGWILIDRCGKHFGIILNFLRDGSCILPESMTSLAELLAEAKYYCIEELAESCERAIENKRKEFHSVCMVPLITSAKEENILISSSSMPVVKLSINRHNNKYSYTTTSDDNLLKNIELFDKLSLRFSGRILFIKDVIGSSEIACWVFYGNGKKIGEVCCTSIGE
jgi:BTB/POZ domain-containing adapter for CUL3-mediated RhoA degradation protein